MKERDLRLDLIKLIAALMVVILHTIENGGGGVFAAMPVSAWYIWNTIIFCS